MSGMDFVAVDFETANRARASVCQVGVAKVQDGALVERYTWLVVPPTGADSFEGQNTRVHGIDATAVRASGISWAEAAARLAAVVRDAPVVAHNAAFDKSVYEETCFHSGIAPLAWDWFDSLALAGRFIDSNRYDLPAVAAALGLPPFEHHDAGADAAAAALVVLELARRFSADTLHDLEATHPGPGQRVAAHMPRRRQGPPLDDESGASVRVKDMPQPHPDADPSHPLHGHRVVVTGALESYSRMGVWRRLAELGAHPQKNVRKDTTLLVLAEEVSIDASYPTHLATEKVQKAARYMAAGQDIRILTGPELLACMDSGSPAPLPGRRTISAPPAAPKPARRTPDRPARDSSPQAPAEIERQQPTPAEAAAHVHATSETETMPPKRSVFYLRVRAVGIFLALIVAGLVMGSLDGIGPLIGLALWVWAGLGLRKRLQAARHIQRRGEAPPPA